VLYKSNFALPLCQIVSRFGVGVAQKLAVQAVPVIGALSGAAVN
jgi:hypothetical protein